MNLSQAPETLSRTWQSMPQSWYVTADAQAELRLACRGYRKLDMAEEETAIKRLDAAAEGWALEASHR